MGLLRRLANLLRHDRLDAEIEEEFRAHLEMAAEDARRRGTPPDEAWRAARMRFGNVSVLRERTVEANTLPLLDELWRDLRHAFRQLGRSPVFAVTAVITLSLGIGATTAVFTLV